MGDKPREQLLEEIKAQIDNEPRSFNMGTWGSRSSRTACGTAACLAGWAVICNGATLDYSTDHYGWGETNRAIYPDGRRVTIEVEAARLLGIEGQGSYNIFRQQNSDAISWVEEQIAKNRARAEAELTPIIEAPAKELTDG